MRVLLMHNRYRQPGGEDSVVRSEAEILRLSGVEVRDLLFDNEPEGWRSTIRLGVRSAWSRESYERVLSVCREFQPHVVHVHNFWLKLSPAAHASAHAGGAATVQTLHNFRLMCANALFLRNGEGCEACLGKNPWRGVAGRCYRGSFLSSASAAHMMVVNRRRGTWRQDVDAFIILSEAARTRFVASGLPPERLHLKPNFVEDPGPAPFRPSHSDIVLFVGRLSEEKGAHILLSAWSALELQRRGRLLLAGDGPQRAALERQAKALGLDARRVTFLGQQEPREVSKLLHQARVVAIPSIWFEQFPRTAAEAFAHGRGLVVSDVGALNEIVRNGRTGLRFAAGDAISLGNTLETILTDDELADTLGGHARAEYLDSFTPRRNFEMLMRIYRAALEHRGMPVPRELYDFAPAAVPLTAPSIPSH